MNNTAKFIVAILIPLTIGLSGSFFTASEIPGWFSQLNKPSWNPPNWLFAPVWTTLYLLMGISLYLVWKSDVSVAFKRSAIILFAIQMVLNFFWSFFFFKMHEMGWAFVEIITLWIFILVTIFAFGKISRLAAWLLVPYICWVSFAAILNYTIWKMN